MNERGTVIIIIGVSGSGKSTIGSLLANNLDMPFFDADDFHSQSNTDKMQSGSALTDKDRWPWLKLLSQKIYEWNKGQGAVLGCSALKESYRQILTSENNGNLQWIFLYGEYDLIFSRLSLRQNHFMHTDLLRSQFDILEAPKYGLHIHVGDTKDGIVKNIMNHLNQKNIVSEIGLIGLGVMGKALSLNIANHDFKLSVYNRSEGGEENTVNDFLSLNNDRKNIRGFNDLASFIESLIKPRKIVIMITAGEAVDLLCEKLIPLLSKGDLILEGGNSHFKDTARRTSSMRKHGIHFIGAGISGGQKGARYGPSIMPGGSRDGYALMAPILESIAANNSQGQACCIYIGPRGAGHFIKMVHNGIEYVEMQLLAEVYALLSPQMSKEEIRQLLTQWNSTELRSYLLEITSHIITYKENGEYLLDMILDQADNNSTGSWSSKAALDLGTVNTMMSSAVFARYISSFKSLRAKYASQLPVDKKNNAIALEHLKQAYTTARVINHHQGFELIRHASDNYHWELDLSGIASIWTNGCIIRSALMESCAEYFKSTNQLLEISELFTVCGDNENALQSVISAGMDLRIHLPSFSAAYQYWIGLTTHTLPANLIQAQRDYFGAHRYQRVDHVDNIYYHTEWE